MYFFNQNGGSHPKLLCVGLNRPCTEDTTDEVNAKTETDQPDLTSWCNMMMTFRDLVPAVFMLCIFILQIYFTVRISLIGYGCHQTRVFRIAFQ